MLPAPSLVHVADARRSRRRRRAGRGRGRTRPAAVGASSSAAPKRCARQGSGHSSLTTTGTPCSGPAGAAASISRERSGKVSTIALIAGFRSSIRASVVVEQLAGSRSPEAIAAACSRSGRSSGAHPAARRERSAARSGLDLAEVEREQLDDRRPEQPVGGADHRHLDLVGLDSERGEARRDEIVCVLAGSSISAGNPTQAPWPGSCNRRRQGPFRRRRRQNPGRNPCAERRVAGEILPESSEKPPDRARAADRGGPRLPAARRWSPPPGPGPPTRRPPGSIVLGQTATTPPPSCPGKIVNNVEVIPCRVEGHVSGFQAIAGGVPQPYEAPFDGKIVAWSITLARPSRTETERPRRGRLLQRIPRQALAGADRRPAPGRRIANRRSTSSSARARCRSSTPTSAAPSIFALEHPLTILQGQVVALTIPTWAPMFAFNVSGDNTWRGSRLPEHCSSKEDIQGGHPQQGVGKTKTYGCYYSNARLLYTATLCRKLPEPCGLERLLGGGRSSGQSLTSSPISWSQRRQARRFSGERGQGGGRGGERQDHRHRLHLLAGLAVDVDGAGLGVGERLAARGRGAHPVELLLVHGREDY